MRVGVGVGVGKRQQWVRDQGITYLLGKKKDFACVASIKVNVK